MKKLKLLLTSALIVSFLTGCSSEKMKLKTDTVTIEYGNNVSSDAKDYLDNTNKFLKEVKIEGIPKNESEKEYPNVGEYELTLKKDKEEQKVKVFIKDTIAPTFTDVKDSYEVKYGEKFDVNSIKTEDLSQVELNIDGDVDYNKAGTYKVNVVAKDESGNETKKEISIVVKEEEKKETSSNSTSSSNSSSKKSNTSESSSSSSSTSKSGGSSSSSSSDKKTNESNNLSSNITGYTCLEGNCSKHFSSWSALEKHRKESGHEHANYGTDHETFEWPSDWD